MLKSDFHCHAGFDIGGVKLPYAEKQLIAYAAKLGYEVLALTNHDTVSHTNELANYAKQKGILLIPGCERTIEGKHVVLLDVTQQQIEKIKTLADLEKYKKENMVVMAPHPFFPDSTALQQQLIDWIQLFDAIEWSHFYLPWINFNHKAARVAKTYNKTLLGTSDCHWFYQLNHTFTKVAATKTKEAVLEAIRKDTVEIETKPPSLKDFSKILYWALPSVLKLRSKGF